MKKDLKEWKKNIVNNRGQPCGTSRKTTLTITIKHNLLELKGFFSKNPKTLGQYIRKIRLDKGISTRKLADRVRCTPEIILEWEKDRCIPGIKLLQKLNNELDIPSKLLKDAVINKYVFKEKVDMAFDAEVLKERLIKCLKKAAKAGLKGRVKVFEDYGFNSLLRLFRYSLFMNSREFARALSVDHSTILDWEMRRHMPFGKMVGRIKEKLATGTNFSFNTDP